MAELYWPFSEVVDAAGDPNGFMLGCRSARGAESGSGEPTVGMVSMSVSGTASSVVLSTWCAPTPRMVEDRLRWDPLDQRRLVRRATSPTSELVPGADARDSRATFLRCRSLISQRRRFYIDELETGLKRRKRKLMGDPHIQMEQWRRCKEDLTYLFYPSSLCFFLFRWRILIWGIQVGRIVVRRL